MTDLQIWEMATYDHAALAVRRAKTPAAAAAALAFAQGSGTSYASRVNDQWNIAGVKFNDGNPSVTSHYGYHMTSWHLVLALSGQRADFSDPANASLTFDPRVAASSAEEEESFSLPVILPGLLGTLSSTGSIKAAAKNGRAAGAQQFKLVWHVVASSAAGRTLHELAVGGHAYPHTPVEVRVGEALVW